jgi:hypothetical protein
MGLVNLQVNELLQEELASPPWGRRERGLICDLTLIKVIDRSVGLTLS